MTPSRSYMSIGDVLKDLKTEFPEVSISKIRFLETEGLIEPERTPSGYRKFYPADVARLKYILRLQRDQFMPLKVIRKRLEHFDPSEGDQPIPSRNGGSGDVPSPVMAEEDDLAGIEGGLQLSLAQLASSSGLTEDQLSELEEYGLVDSHVLDDGDVYYDEGDLLVAKLARDFGKYGIEARHLKMYKNFADKEVGLFEQIVVPRTKGGGEGKRQAGQSMAELAKLSKRLKDLLLKARLRDSIDV